MNERFTLDNTLTDIAENERVNRKLPYLFDLELCGQVKWPFSKMKLKHMMKLVPFPAQELVSAANLILARREAGEKISIPIWRDLPEEEAAAAEAVVLIPYGRNGETAPAVLVCPGEDDRQLKMVSEGMTAAEEIREAGCHGFILHYRPDRGGEDMARAVRFLRANGGKLGIEEGKLALLAFGSAVQSAEDLYAHPEQAVDSTHRYDQLLPKPDQLWPVSSDGSVTGQWLQERVKALMGEER